MKLKTLAAWAPIFAFGVISAFAQMPPPESTASPDGSPAAPGDRQKRRFLEDLPPDIRKRFDEARAKALEDPEVKELKAKFDEASRNFFESVRTKMQEIDPGLSEYIKKQAGARRDWMRGGIFENGWSNLSEAERQQLLAAREKAKEDPVVKAAQEKRNAASTPDERRTASEEYRKVMHDALLKIDPSLKPILDKLAPTPAPASPAPTPAQP